VSLTVAFGAPASVDWPIYLGHVVAGLGGDSGAYDADTGKIRWTFHTVPHPGNFGHDTWSPGAWKVAGGANAWSAVTVDAKRGTALYATGSASFDFYCANRLGDNQSVDSIVAFDANTGERTWHFQ